MSPIPMSSALKPRNFPASSCILTSFSDLLHGKCFMRIGILNVWLSLKKEFMIELKFSLMTRFIRSKNCSGSFSNNSLDSVARVFNSLSPGRIILLCRASLSSRIGNISGFSSV